jgi:hypothetical protein
LPHGGAPAEDNAALSLRRRTLRNRFSRPSLPIAMGRARRAGDLPPAAWLRFFSLTSPIGQRLPEFRD